MSTLLGLLNHYYIGDKFLENPKSFTLCIPTFSGRGNSIFYSLRVLTIDRKNKDLNDFVTRLNEQEGLAKNVFTFDQLIIDNQLLKNFSVELFRKPNSILFDNFFFKDDKIELKNNELIIHRSSHFEQDLNRLDLKDFKIKTDECFIENCSSVLYKSLLNNKKIDKELKNKLYVFLDNEHINPVELFSNYDLLSKDDFFSTKYQELFKDFSNDPDLSRYIKECNELLKICENFSNDLLHFGK